MSHSQNPEKEDVRGEILYKDDRHQFIWLGWEEEEEAGVVQVNQYLIIHDGVGVLLDPGGVQVFPRVVDNLSRHIDCRQIRHIFFSHQDPDVCSGLALWTGITPATIHLSKLWARFVPHFGSVDIGRLSVVDDSGGKLSLNGNAYVEFIPAHFLHSVGNFSLWDPGSRILFSADIGAAVFPPQQRYLFVEDFEVHCRYMDGFHRRYMTAQSACRKWAADVRRLQPSMIAPQHGAVFRGRNVARFLSWLEKLRCGVDLLDEFYGGH